MSLETLIYIIISGIIALLIALFQYFNKKKSVSKLDMLFLFLRFVTLFSVLILIINPKFDQITVSTEKPNLIVAVDNSNSIKHLKQDTKVRFLVDKIRNNEDLKNKFNLEFCTFGEDLISSDSLTFKEKQTNIDEAFSQLSQIYKQSTSPILLITDGNQTIGNDYEFVFSKYKQPIYTVVVGDTIVYSDLKIEQLNVNKYAYLKNSFPIEAILVYNGNNKMNSKFIVTNGGRTVYSQDVNFTKSSNSKVLNFTLPTSKVGVNSYKVTLIPIENEKNIINNTKNFAIEVIDQKIKIGIVSDFSHPDLGVFKKSIESNEQQSVSFFNPKEIISQINDFELIIVYQPNNKFNALFEVLKEQDKNKFIVIGSKTDLNFLNRVNESYKCEITQQLEDYQAELNANYIPFIIDDLDFESLPPLKSVYGSVNFNIPFQTILNKTIRGVSLGEPLLATFETDGRREAVLFGENIWQWRAQSFLNTRSFNEFDDFIGKIIQYLRSNKKRDRLNLEYETFYNGYSNIILKAQFFDKAYQFDSRESLSITIKNKESKDEKVLPLILKNNDYEVDLTDFSAGEYSFTVKAQNENISKSGSFKILDYNVEQQFLNANVGKLQRVSNNSLATSYFIDNTADLIDDLLNDNRYVTIQKSSKNSLPLIDWKFLLIIIALSLSAEWFLRKYNGLI